ncbi:MAG: toxin-antitoxin system HicB family antitoxin [Actinomycetota bacterium]
MELSEYASALRGELGAITRFANEDIARAGQMLADALDSSVRLTLLDVLSAAAAEITTGLGDTVVELRLAGGEPSFVFSPGPPEPAEEAPAPAPAESGEEGGSSRISLRMPDALKARIEASAAQEGLSVNTWLVRAATWAVDGPPLPPRPPVGPRPPMPPMPPAPPGSSRRGPGSRITGYARS